MVTATLKDRKDRLVTENAFARKALEAVGQIEREAQEKKMAHLESLKSARAALFERIEDFNRQLTQLDQAMAAITGRPTAQERRTRRSLDESRVRVMRWMEGRRGQMFSASDLVREFPELNGAVISVFLKPLLNEGQLQRDTTEGIRRAKYFVKG